MDLSVFFAGTAGSVPSARRGLPALLLRCGGDRLLFDCGEGTQRQLVRSVGLVDVDEVFLTHLHLDHWLGLLGMIKSFELRDRERPLTVYGPVGTVALLNGLRPIYGRLHFPMSVAELQSGDGVPHDGYSVTAFTVRHRGSALGYALVEDVRPGRFDAELAERLGVRPGPDFGRLQHGETIAGVAPEQVMGPSRPGRKIVISGDTAPCEAVAVASHQADLLVHEATFGDEEADRARHTEHTTARQAAQLALEADVRLLALTHISTRYAGGELRDEARAVFAATEVPRDFDTIEVPLPEKGPPALRRWEGQSRGAPAAGPVVA
ncbi:MAG TPA: ribonuclease Z [Solirubrobacteraceae bacterium]|jgi:ribonuclease Z|nr:ribonuclease Z [Solirubrobacteraceae bacterium]